MFLIQGTHGKSKHLIVLKLRVIQQHDTPLLRIYLLLKVLKVADPLHLADLLRPYLHLGIKPKPINESSHKLVKRIYLAALLVAEFIHVHIFGVEVVDGLVIAEAVFAVAFFVVAGAGVGAGAVLDVSLHIFLTS